MHSRILPSPTGQQISMHPIIRTPCFHDAMLHLHSTYSTLCHQGAGSSALVSPGRRQHTDGLVVAGETVNAGLDENEPELGVLVLAVALEVLADGDGLPLNVSMLAEKVA